MVDVIASLEAVIGANITGLQRGLQEADRGLSGFAQTMSQRLDGMGASMQKVGLGLTALTAPLVAFGAQGVRVASSFEDAMAEISARTGIVGSELQQISDFALQMGADTVFSAQQAAQGFLQLLTSGQSAAEAMQTLPAVLTAAAASGEDLGRTADYLTDILASFGANADSVGDVVEILAQAAGASSATMGSLADGFANVGGVAHEFGLSVLDTAGILALFSERGIKGAEAGTQLRSMLNQMTRDTEESRSAWAKLGTSMFDATGQARPIAAVMRDIRGALESMTQEARISVIKDLAGSYGQLGLAALTSGSSLEDMLGLMGGAASAADVAAARMNTFSGRVEALRGSIQTLQIKAMTPFTDSLKPTIERATDLVNRLSAWAEANPELTTQIVAMVAAVAGLGAGLLTVGTAIRLISPALAALKGITLLGIASTLGMVVAGIAATVVGVGVLAQKLGIDLVGGIEHAAQSFGTFQERLQDLQIDTFEGAIRHLFATFEDGSSFVGGVLEGFGMARDKAQEWAGTINAVANEVIGILPTIPFYFEYFLGKIWSTVQPLLQPVLDWFTGTGSNSLGGALQAVGGWVEQNVIAPLRGIWVAAGPLLAPVVDWFNTDFANAVNLVLGTVNDLKNGLINFWNAIQPTIQPVIDGLGDLIGALFQPFIEIANQALDAWEQLRRLGGGAPQRTLPGEIAPGVKDPSTPYRLIEDAGAGYKPGKDLWADIGRTLAGAVDIVRRKLMEKYQQASLDVQLALDGLGASAELGGKQFKAAADEASSKLSLSGGRLTKTTYDTGTQVGDAMSGFASLLLGRLPSMTGAIQTVGANLWAALGDFVSGLRDWAVSTFEQIFNMGASGAQNTNLIGTAFDNPQVVDDRMAAILDAYKNYYYPGMASGGPVLAGQTYVVGERGPELFTPARGGTITPNGGQSDPNVADEVVRRVLAALTPGQTRASAGLVDRITDAVLAALAAAP